MSFGAATDGSLRENDYGTAWHSHRAVALWCMRARLFSFWPT